MNLSDFVAHQKQPPLLRTDFVKRGLQFVDRTRWIVSESGEVRVRRDKVIGSCVIFSAAVFSLSATGVIHFDVLGTRGLDPHRLDLGRRDSVDERPELVISGSTALMQIYRDVTRDDALLATSRIEHGISSSTHSIQDLLNGVIDVARLSRRVANEEYEESVRAKMPLREYLIGFDAVSLMVHPSKRAFVTHLTQEQIQGIFFSGSLDDWNQLSPLIRGPILPLGTDVKTNHSAQLLMNTMAGKFDLYHHRVRLVDTEMETIERVASDPEAMGFARTSLPMQGVYQVPVGKNLLEARAPESRSIRTGLYPLTHYYYAVICEPRSKLQSLLIERLLHERGQRRIAELGCLPYRNLPSE